MSPAEADAARRLGGYDGALGPGGGNGGGLGMALTLALAPKATCSCAAADGFSSAHSLYISCSF